MARYNVQHPETKQWRCFSSIVDDYITDWMDEEEYEQWRKSEYGDTNFSPVRECNLMDFNEAERIVNNR